jgi:hypothetical protein
MDYEAARTALSDRKVLRDKWYSVGIDIFHQLLNDGKWVQINEYTFELKRQDETSLKINLRNDVLYGAGGVARSDGLDYLIDMLELNGGTLDGIVPAPRVPEGKIRLKPPYQLRSLTPREKWVHYNRIPPEREQLQEIVRYDEEICRLYWVVNADEGRYESVTAAPEYFIEISGVQYARWRVISQLWFSNPHGIEDLEECRKVLKNMPENDAEWKKTIKAVNSEYLEHMNERGENYRERRTLRLTPQVRAERAKMEAILAENGKLKMRVAGYETQAALRAKQAAEKNAEKEKEPMSLNEKLRKRAERLYRKSSRGLT